MERRCCSVSLEMEYIVDVQGFKESVNRFVFKELAVLSLAEDEDNAEPKLFLFEQPYEWNRLPAKYKAENRWLERNFHGLSWNSGDVPYEKVETTLRNALGNATRVYVKGLEKKRWIKNVIPDMCVVDMDNLECPSLKKLRVSDACPNHAFYGNCAVENVKLLSKWYRETPSLERALTRYVNVENLASMRSEDIACLPKDFLIIFASEHIEDAWDKLPDSMKEDPDIAECRRCRIHNLSKDGEDDFDGPSPMIKHCFKCNTFYS